MSTITQIPRTNSPPVFDNAQEWHDNLGDVPLHRIIFNPLPGTATEAHLLALVDGDNKRLCELVDGTLVEKIMGRYESFLAGWLITYLNLFLESNELGVVLGEAALLRLYSGRVRAPDVSFFSFDRLAGRGLMEERISSRSADLAIEVYSESNTAAEMQKKILEYFNSGTQLVWIVYPKSKTVDVFEQLGEFPTKTLDERDILDGGAVIPGFKIELTKLFNRRSK